MFKIRTFTRFLFQLLVLVFCLKLCSAIKNETKSQEDALQKWISLRKSIRNSVDSLTKMILPTAISFSYEADLSGECMSSLLKLFNGIRNLKKWAISMLDASGKVTPGFLSGSLTDLGDYDLCLSLNDEGKYSTKSLTGQYCTVEIRPPLPPIPRKLFTNDKLVKGFSEFVDEDELFALLNQWVAVFYRVPIRAGLCMPSTCNIEDVKKIGELVLNTLPELDIQVPSCEIKTTPAIIPEQIFVLSCFGVLLLITMVCTLVDVLTKRRNPIPRFRRHFLHFSLWKNAERFFGEEEAKPSNGHLQVLDGIRWWSMAWICFTHTYGLIPLHAQGNLMNYFDFLTDIWFGLVSSAWVSVDVFFLIGGILVAYTTLGQLQRENGRMNFLKNLFRRLWRLTPVLLTVIGIVFLLPFFGSGPLWNETINKQVELCRNNWWLAALYGNSWLGHAQACLVPTWYVSADLHLYIISPLFIYAFYKSQVLGVALCLGAIVASCIAVFVLNMQHDLYPYVMFMTFNDESTEDVFTTVYFRPYAHVGPYMVGLLFGCFMKRYPKLTPRWFTVLGGWCVSITLAMCVLIGPYHWSLGELPSNFVSAIFQSLHKTAFALAVAWVIWASYYGYAGVVSTLLSWDGYKKLSQLVYSIYLMQLPVLWVRVGNLRKTIVSSHYNFFTEFLGIFVISSLLAVVLYLLVESPFASLDSAMFPKRHKKPSTIQVPADKGKSRFQESGKDRNKESPVECINISPLSVNGKL